PVAPARTPGGADRLRRPLLAPVPAGDSARSGPERPEQPARVAERPAPRAADFVLGLTATPPTLDQVTQCYLAGRFLHLSRCRSTSTSSGTASSSRTSGSATSGRSTRARSSVWHGRSRTR